MIVRSPFATVTELMVHVARADGWVSSKVLYGALACSRSQLEQIAIPLVQQGLLRSRRGPGGGYTLTSPANTIPLTRIADAFDKPSPKAFERWLWDAMRHATLADLL